MTLLPKLSGTTIAEHEAAFYHERCASRKAKIDKALFGLLGPCMGGDRLRDLFPDYSDISCIWSGVKQRILSVAEIDISSDGINVTLLPQDFFIPNYGQYGQLVS